MASSRNPTKLAAFMAPLPLFALLFLSGALEAVVGASNDTSAAGASYTCSSGSMFLASSASQSVFSLDRYGARGDGRHDDTRARSRQGVEGGVRLAAAGRRARPQRQALPAKGRHPPWPVQVQRHGHREGHAGGVAE